MTEIISSSFNDESINVVLQYEPPNLVNVEDDINQTRVIVRQPATLVNAGDRPLLEYAEVAKSASYAKSASFIADDSDIYDWVRTTFYVSATDGSDDNDGKTPIYPFKTIKRAALAAKNFITGSKLIDPTIPEEAPRVTIRLSTGFYEEEAPIQIPEWTSVCGNDLRTCVVRPTPATKGENLFQVNRGFYADGLRLEGCEIDDLTNPRSGFFFAFQEGAFITTSPYIQNCTAAFVPFDLFYAPLDPFATPQPNPAIGNGPGGMIVDDSVLDPYSPLKSMIVDAYTQVAFNGIGLVTRGAGYAQMVSFFTNFSHVGTWAIDGGHASLLNSNTTFGDYGLRAEGYRIIVVPDYDGVNSYQSEADSLLLSSSINDVRNYMMAQLQLSGSYRTDYLDTGSRIHQLTLKDSGLLIDALATDLLALTPGKTVNWIQSQFKGQDVSADKRYTIPTSSLTSASGFVKGPYAAFRINDNTYTASVPFTEASTSRDSGYLVNATATDILYGGNERSVEAARWFWVRPSVANTTQLQPTLDGIEIVKELTTNALQSVSQSAFVSKSESNIQLSFTVLEAESATSTGSLPTIVPNTVDNIKVTNLSSVTSSVIVSSSLVNQATASFETVYDIIERGTGSMPTLITNAENLIRVTTSSTQFTTGSSALSQVPLVVSGFNIVLNIVENGTGSLPTTVLNTANNIKVTAFTPTTSSASATATEVSSSETLFGVVTSIITNGTGSLPAVLSNASESIKVSSIPQITSASAASGSEVTTISSSFAIVNYIIINGTGSMPALVENTSESIKFNNTAQITSASGAGNTEVTKISSSAALVTNIITNGTGSIPALVLNTSESIKFTNTTQITSASSATATEANIISSSFAVVTKIISNGTGSIPTLVENTSGSIKFTNLSTTTSASSAGNTEVTKISSSMALIMNIISTGTGSLPSVIPNTSESIKFTNTAQITSASSATQTEVTKVSSSVAIVTNIITNGTGSLPIIVYNTEENIKFTNTAQIVSGSLTGSSSDVSAISASIALVANIVSNGTGSLPGVIPYTTQSSDPNTIAAYNLLKDNIPFIQSEVIAYISSSWSTASYNEASCSRDIGYIVSGAAEDLLYGSNSSSIYNGVYYYEFPSQATGTQLNFTVDGIKFANRLAQKVVQNITFTTGSVERRATWDLLRANRTLLQNEVIAYISSSWSTASYNEDTCKRDVGYIIDAVSTDIYYGGNERSVEAGRYYYLYPSQATGSQLNFTIDGINHASGLAQQLIQNITLVTGSTERRATWDLLRSNIQFIQEETIAYISSSWSTASYNEDTCKRDVNYILDAVMTDVYYGGNQRSIEAGRYYYLYPSQATGNQLNFTIDGIKYASRIAQKIVVNETFTTASAERRVSWNLLRANRTFLQNEVIAYISSSWSTASYNEDTCKRDVGYIVDAVSTDVYYGGNERSIEAGRYYFLYPSQATGTQLNFTVDGINHASWLSQKVVQNITFTTASVERRATWDLLRANKAFIQSEVISYISSSWSTASYDQDKCYRDVGYIIDGIVTDIYYGGNQRSIESGRYYYLYPSQATNTQLDFTIDGVNYASRIAQKIAQNVSFVTASASRRIAWQLLRANSPFIQAEVIAYISSSWSTASYDETKCKRDVNYILDSVSTDVYYGGNERSRQAGFYYYKYPSQATGNQVNFTVDGVEYASKLGQKVVQNVTFVTASVARRASWNLMRNNKTFIAEEVIAYISSSWPTASYDSLKCKRDVGYIVDSVSTDILYGGNERSIEAGRYYYLYPSQATTAQLNFTIDGINYAKGLAKKLIVNTPYVSPSTASWAAKELLIRNKPLIQAEVIQYISSSWVTSSRSMVGFVYDQDKCFRDVGYILDGVATDILYGGNQRSIESGRYYYLYPNEATNNRTQLDPTLDGIEYARNIAVKIVSGSTLVTASANSLAARELINLNKAFIQAETIAFLSSSWKDFNYSSVTCSRDIGYILDAVKTDLVYGGNQRSRDAGFYYYKYPNQATSAQDAATVAGVRYAKNLTQKILQNATFTTASADRLAAWNALMSNKPYIQEQVVIRLKTNISFDEADTVRDAGYIVQAVATDILYGGNERATEAGRYFYKFPSGVLNAVKSETLEGIALIKEYAQNYLESTIAKSEIPKLRDEVDLVYDILDNGTGSISNVLVRNASGATRFTSASQFTSSATISAGLIESASTVLQAVLDIIEYGTGSAPTLIKNTSGRIKKSALSPVTFTGSLSQSVINLVTASAKITADILDYGTGSAPALVNNTVNNIIVSNITPYTGSVTASSAEITKVSSSFALVTRIISNGTGSLPTLVRNTSESIKYTGTAQVTSSATASATEVTKISSSVAFVIDVITNGTGSLPALVLNTAENIKFTTASQYTSASGAGTPEVTKISSSFATVTNIISTGTGSLPTIVSNTSESIKFTNTPQVTSASSAGNAEATVISSSISTITSIIRLGTGSLPAIQTNVSESIKFTNTAQVTTSSYTANGADITALSASIALVTNIIINGTGSLPALIPYTTQSTDPATITAYNLVKSNIALIQAEVIAYISSSWSTASYNEASCSRDVGYIVSGAAEDLLYGSNSASLANGIYYYLFPSQATGTQLNFTVDGVKFANEMTQKIANNITFTTASAERRVAWNLLRANKTFLQNETIAYISSSWSTASYNEDTCKRDVGYIVDALATDVYYGGNQRSIEAGRYYYLYPSQATSTQANFTIDGIVFAGEVAQKLIKNVSFTTGSIARRATWNLLNANKDFIKNEVIAYISSSWSTASYDQDKCMRDVGYILDAVATDIYYGGNARSIEAGRYYYLYPSQATGNQVNFTVDGINHASWLAQKIAQNITFTTASDARRNAWNLLNQNKAFVQDETIAYLSASWYGFDYDSAKCRRDVGYIIDGLATDIYYGGNERSRESGRYYYLYPSQATGSQLDQTVDGMEYASTLAQKVIQSIQFVTASESRLAVRNILYNNIPLLQEETVAYISSSWSTASYDEVKCKRDVGYIVGGIIADVLYGGNQRTIDSGVYYYRYPSSATTSQLNFTIDGINYANRIAQKLLVNTPLVQPDATKRAAYNAVRASTPFIVAEVVPYISSSWSTLNYNTAKCERDSVYIVDSILTDFLYGGNERSIYAGNYYYLYNVSEVTSEQVEETTTGIKYIGNLIEAIMQGATFNLPTQNKLDAAELLFKNKTFIAEEIIPYVSASWTGSTYNAEKCKRDVGYILDGVITDIVYGGNERSIESGVSYYLYPLTVLQDGVYVRVNATQPPATPSPAISNERDFTYAGTRYLKGMAIEVLKNTVFQPVTNVRQTAYDILTTNKTTIAQAVLAKLLDGQEKCMVCDYILAHNKIREYIINDPEGKLVDLSAAAKVKVGQMMAMVTGTLESVVLDLEPTYLQEFGSLITSTSHVFEFGGSGANYLALPSNQYGIGQSNADLRVFQADGGRIYTSFGDETGDFFIGLDFTIRQATGTIEGRTFNKATAARFTPLILALT